MCFGSEKIASGVLLDGVLLSEKPRTICYSQQIGQSSPNYFLLWLGTCVGGGDGMGRGGDKVLTSILRKKYYFKGHTIVLNAFSPLTLNDYQQESYYYSKNYQP